MCSYGLNGAYIVASPKAGLLFSEAPKSPGATNVMAAFVTKPRVPAQLWGSRRLVNNGSLLEGAKPMRSRGFDKSFLKAVDFYVLSLVTSFLEPFRGHNDLDYGYGFGFVLWGESYREGVC